MSLQRHTKSKNIIKKPKQSFNGGSKNQADLWKGPWWRWISGGTKSYFVPWAGHYNSTISTIVFAIIGIFEGGGGPDTSGSSPTKDKWALQNWLNKLSNDLKTLSRKTLEAFPAILSGFVNGFVAKRTLTLTEFVSGFIVLRLI